MNSSSNYTYNPAAIDFTNGVAELSASNQTDNSLSLFNQGAMTGSVFYDQSNGYLRLSSSGPNLELDSSWTPAWSSLLAYWKLNDTVGSATIIDSTGNGNTGTLQGGVTLGVSGELNTAGQFNGTTGYITAGSNFPTGASGAYTKAAWIYITSSATSNNIVSGASSHAFWAPGNVLAAGHNGAWNVVQDPTAMATNTWYHVAVTYNPVGGVMTLYKDGQQVSQATAVSTQNDPFVQIGAYSGANNFTGKIDDVAIWTTPLSASAINSIYQHEASKYAGTLTSRVMDGHSANQSRPTLSWVPTLPFLKELPDGGNSENNYASQSSSLMSGITAIWHLDEAAGTTGANVKDQSGQSTPNTGTPSGSVTFGVSGKLGTSASLSSGGYIMASGLLGSPSSATLAAWVNLAAAGIAGAEAISLGDCVAIRLDATPALGVGGFFHNGGTWSNTSSGLFVAGTGWHHVAYTVTNGSQYVYLDGKQVAATAVNSPISYAGDGSNTFIGHHGNGNNNYGFTGAIDEVSVWSRVLSGPEILELYRRGADRIKYQVRSCSDSGCATGSPIWLGPDGTNQTYFSELNNNAVPSDGADVNSSDSVPTGLPVLTYSSFASLGLSAQRYFQYRAILESDDGNTLCNYGGGANTAPCSPELKSVSAGSSNYDSSGAAIANRTGVNYTYLANFIETLGSSGCPNGALYDLSPDNTHWYYWTGAAWGLATGTTATANPASTIATNAPSFATQVGAGTIYFKAFLQSSGSSACQIQNVEIDGLH